MQCYLKIQQEARRQQAEREHSQSGEIGGQASKPSLLSPPPTQISGTPIIHFVETAPSVLRELPWILLKEHKVYTM